MIRFDPPMVEGGGAVTLTVQASDDLSGVKSVKGEVRSPNGSAVLPFMLQDAGGGVFSNAIPIPREAESGVWFVKWMALTDGARNTTLVQANTAAGAPPGGSFSVFSSESDSTAPDVIQVWFDKVEIAGGEKNLIRVQARDDGSGVASMMGAVQSPSKSARVWFTGVQDAEPGMWSAEFLIPQNADCGEWGVQQLSVKDKAGNTTLLPESSPILTHAGFKVSIRNDCDSTPPTLDSLDLSPTAVSNATATEILVIARVHDEGTGTVSMTGWFDGPKSQGGQTPNIFFRCSGNPKDPQAPWTGKIQVPQFAPKGTWKVGVIRLQDNAANYREYTATDPVVSGDTFTVQ